MTEKELKRLSRKELLQMMILQAEENERLRAELDQLRQQLKENRIMMNNAGSIAEVSMELHKVFDAAQAAADTYLENIRRMHSRQETYCIGMIERANEEAAAIIRSAKERAKYEENHSDF